MRGEEGRVSRGFQVPRVSQRAHGLSGLGPPWGICAGAWRICLVISGGLIHEWQTIQIKNSLRFHEAESMSYNCDYAEVL